MSEKDKWGRPTVMTPDVLLKLEQAFAIGCTDIEACIYADIGARTLYTYQENNPEFQQRKEELKQRPVLKARRKVVEAIDHDPEMAFKYLERKCKGEFSPREERTGAGGKDLFPSGFHIVVDEAADSAPIPTADKPE